jgi:hypothetical protein
MKMRLLATSVAAFACCACNQATDDAVINNAAAAVASDAPVPPADGTQSVQANLSEIVESNVSMPDDRTPLEEPHGPIDPKSAEGAGQVVQQYGALIEQGRWTESWKLWSSTDAAKRFDRNWREDAEVHMEIGKLGPPEGAAGSIYLSEPVVFYGQTKSGASFRRAATVTLRRVNDVPGSTEAQRRWRIESIKLG